MKFCISRPKTFPSKLRTHLFNLNAKYHSIASQKVANRIKVLNPKGNIFSEYSALAERHNAINLGQGFPSLPLQNFIQKIGESVFHDKGLVHQYARSHGHPRFIKALAKFFSPKLNRSLDEEKEILTTVGATEGIQLAMQTFIEPGDEVLVLTPFFDSYVNSAILAGGVVRGVPLVPSDSTDLSGFTLANEWSINFNRLEEIASQQRTKMLIVNSPHNPTGKVFSKDELQKLAAIAEKYDLLVLSDEVYEAICFDGHEHIKFASLPNMFERTITLGSVGKTFGVTGWNCGWAIGPEKLIRPMWLYHSYNTYAVPKPIQEIAAQCFETAEKNHYFERIGNEYLELRDQLLQVLSNTGFKVVRPSGGYFAMADFSELSKRISPAEFKKEPFFDASFCKYLVQKAKVCAIPISHFYLPGECPVKVDVGGRIARFAFCKTKDMISAAGKNLNQFLKHL